MSSSFDESVEKYRSFLESNGYSPNTVWITPRDVLVCDRPSVYVKIPVPAENAEQARELFECRISQQKGVLFKTTCASKDATFIHAWVPRDEDEAQRHLMPKDLKMSASIGLSRLPARVVRSRWLWWLLQLRYRRFQKNKGQWFSQE